MDLLKKPTPTQSLMVFLTMILSGMLLFALFGYVSAQYLGGRWMACAIGAFGSLMMLLVLPRAMRDVRTETYHNAVSGKPEEPLGRRSENINILNAVWYVVMAAYSGFSLRYVFIHVGVPWGAKLLLGIVLSLCVSLTLTNLRYAWLRWRDSRKVRIGAR